MGIGLILSLLVIGLILLAIELFVAPGITVFGVLGGLTIAIALIFSFAYLPFHTAIILLFISFLLVSALVWLVLRYGFKGRFGLRFRETGFKPHQENYLNLLGKNGVTATPLRPSGTIRVENRLYSAQSQGDFIEKGELVTVVQVEGNKIIVNKIN